MRKGRIRPSEQVRQQMEELLGDGIGEQSSLLGMLVRLGVQLIVQEALEQEKKERLRRVHYQHRQPGEPRGGVPQWLRSG